VEHNIDETIRRYEIGEAARQKVPCYIGWIQPRMKVDGTIWPCNSCQWPVGNFREQSFREIWNSPAYRSFRRETLSPTAAALIDERCDCSFCCHVSDNMRVHNFYKWLSPLSRVFGKPRTSTEF
jgi:radical SAM protein with 4Fe4S-binding SPASM domain